MGQGRMARFFTPVALGAALLATLASASDFADGLMGGPDTWEVAGVPEGDALNLRAEPSIRARVITRFDNGTRLANKGCAVRGNQRWCRVVPTGQNASQNALQGWVNGRYLREAAAH